MLKKTISTPLSQEQLFSHLFDAWCLKFQEIPNYNSLIILLSQVCLETGHGKLMKNNNWGNLKRGNYPDYCQYECGEYLNGKFQMFFPPHPETQFASFNTPTEGALNYISFVADRQRYISAWEQLLKGNPYRYVEELKLRGPYFTAPLDKYTGVLVSLFDSLKKKFQNLFEQKKSETEDVSEVLNEIKSNLIPLLEDKKLTFDIKYPEKKYGIVWITVLLSANKSLKIEYQHDVGYGLHSGDTDGFYQVFYSLSPKEIIDHI